MLKLFKKINICSNGCVTFSSNSEILNNNKKKVIFKNLDAKNFEIYLKKSDNKKVKSSLNKKYLF